LISRTVNKLPFFFNETKGGIYYGIYNN